VIGSERVEMKSRVRGGAGIAGHHQPAARRSGDRRTSASGFPSAVVMTDRTSRIVAWNEGAEGLLGFRASEMIGKAFGMALEARDLFGNRVCAAGCGLHQMLEAGETVKPFVIETTTAGGEPVRVVVSIDRAGAELAPGRIVYTMRLDGRRRVRDRRGVDQQAAFSLLGKATSSNEAATFARLTAAEQNVLRMLSTGETTEEIAKRLCISASTVRNHIQHVLVKFGVSSKLQAVSIALRAGVL
jgi:DNA-binding CsgD family transcriptional regulator